MLLANHLAFAGCDGKEIKVHPTGTRLSYELTGDNVKDSEQTGEVHNSERVIGKFTGKGEYTVRFTNEENGESCTYTGKATEEWLSCDNKDVSNNCLGKPTNLHVTSGAGHKYHDIYLRKKKKHPIQ